MIMNSRPHEAKVQTAAFNHIVSTKESHPWRAHRVCGQDASGKRALCSSC